MSDLDFQGSCHLQCLTSVGVKLDVLLVCSCLLGNRYWYVSAEITRRDALVSISMVSGWPSANNSTSNSF